LTQGAEFSDHNRQCASNKRKATQQQEAGDGLNRLRIRRKSL
jgi:hypothetical protein